MKSDPGVRNQNSLNEKGEILCVGVKSGRNISMLYPLNFGLNARETFRTNLKGAETEEQPSDMWGARKRCN